MAISNKPVAIVLGGTNPHIALVKNLQARGYRVVLLDYYENPPAKAHADEHHRLSTLDKEAVVECAKNLGASLVISTCIDHANVTACFVAMQLNLPSPYSYATAVEVTDKVLMKQKMKSAGVPTSDFAIISSNESISELGHLHFPLIVKPTDSTGSAGVRVCRNQAELTTNLESALNLSRNGKAIVEEFIEGQEISADFAVENGIAKPLLIRKKFFMNKESDWVMQSPGNIAPASFPAEVVHQINCAAQKITEEFSILNSPLLMQGIVHNDGFNVIEFAPRIGGGMSYKTVEELTGFRLLDYSIDTYFGAQQIEVTNAREGYLATLIIYAKPGKFASIHGIEKLLERGDIESFHSYKTIGMEISHDMSTKSRIGALTIAGSSLLEITHKIESIAQHLKVTGENGEDLTRQNIFEDVINGLL
jgi:biotin carboxylase